MSKSKLEKTLPDYLAIAVTPILIILLVGSLVFFLQTLFYNGSYSERMRWILGWFVVGQVLIARIAIESGRSHASVFTLGLGTAVALALMRFLPEKQFIAMGFLALIWWCSEKLTWDCTLIEDSEDASGEGLLQIAGVAEQPEIAASSPQTEAKPVENLSFWTRALSNSLERNAQTHAPGLWVVYFSLVALPLFGFGQALIPTQRITDRAFGFQCVFIYIGAALGLLMLTSFLGLRRYLRQRSLQMPNKMALNWVIFGSALTTAIMLLALLLPQPLGQYSANTIIDRIGDSIQEVSDRAFVKVDGVQKPDQAGEATPGDNQQQPPQDQPQGNQPQGNQPQGNQPQGNQPQGNQPQGNQPQGNQPQGNQPQGNQPQGNQPQGNQPQGNQPQGNQPQGNQPQGNQPQGNQPQGNQPQGNQPQGNQPQGNQPQGNQPQGNQPQGNQPQGNQPQGNQPQGNQPQGNQPQGNQPQGNQPQGNQPQAQENQEQPPDQQTLPEAPEPSSSDWSPSAKTIFVWLVYGTVACAGIYLAIRNWAKIHVFLESLWRDLLKMFGSEPAAASEEQALDVAKVPDRPFLDYPNPFRNGRANRVSNVDLVRYSFDALEAWATDNSVPRAPDQTPMEFGQALLAAKVAFSTDANELTQLYARVAYANHVPPDDCRDLLQRLWQRMK